VFVALLSVCGSSERLPPETGGDGGLYLKWARDFPQHVIVEKLDAYHVQRIAVPALLYYASEILHLERSDKALLRMWRGLDLACLTLIAWLWCRIARRLHVSTPGKWLGAIFLFVNFAVLKWTAYYAHLTDIPAYAEGMLMLYYYLKRRPLPLAVVSFIGAFTWPTALYVGVVLLLLPRERWGAVRPPAPAPLGLNLILAGAAAVIVYLRLQWLHHRGGILGGQEQPCPAAFTNLSIGLCAAYIFAALAYLWNDRRGYRLSYYLGCLKTHSFWLGIAVLMAVRLTMQQLGPRPTPYTPDLVLNYMLWSGVLAPGNFLVAHVIFYGPVVLFAVLLWKPFCALVQRYGAGLAVIVAFTVLMGIGSESRRIFNLVPLLVPFVVKVIDAYAWPRGRYVFVALVSLLGSKLWLTINPDMAGNLLQMNVGPWMTPTWYAIHAIVILFLGYVLYTFTRSNQPSAVGGQVAS
jgi:hypothetical protein